MRNYVIVKDMTKLFNKEMLLYSLADFSFKTPKRVSFLVYSILLFGIYSVPLIYFLWPLNQYTAMLALIPPFVLGNLMSKPIWGGKSFISWGKCQIKFILSKKRYYDGIGNKKLRAKYTVDHSYTVSRRKDYYELARYIEEMEL